MSAVSEEPPSPPALPPGQSARSDPRPGDEKGEPPRDGRARHEEPGSEEEQRRIDANRGRRAQGLSYLLGRTWYAGSGPSAGRDHNSTHAGRDQYTYHAEGDIYFTSPDFDTAPRFGPLTSEDLAICERRHVVTASDDAVVERLQACGVVVLYGAPATGKRDSATWALASLLLKRQNVPRFPVEIAEVATVAALLPARADDPPARRAATWQLVPGRGYLLDASALRDR